MPHAHSGLAKFQHNWLAFESWYGWECVPNMCWMIFECVPNWFKHQNQFVHPKLCNCRTSCLFQSFKINERLFLISPETLHKPHNAEQKLKRLNQVDYILTFHGPFWLWLLTGFTPSITSYSQTWEGGMMNSLQADRPIVPDIVQFLGKYQWQVCGFHDCCSLLWSLWLVTWNEIVARCCQGL